MLYKGTQGMLILIFSMPMSDGCYIFITFICKEED